jgi:hypothetical protein
MRIPICRTFILPIALLIHADAQTVTQTLSTTVEGHPQMSAANYVLDAGFDPTGGAVTQSTGGSIVLKPGFIGQITDPRALVVSTPDLGEGSTAVANTTAILDDETTAVLPPGAITWEALSGPVSAIDPNGMIHPQSVFEDTAASIRGTWLEVAGVGAFTVLNTNDDNVAPVAGDGIDDSWQFLYFDRDGNGALTGIEGDAAQADADSDGDDHDNLFEFLSDHDPIDPASFLDIQITGVASGTVVIELSKIVASTRYTLVGSEDLGIHLPWAIIGRPISGIDQRDYEFLHPSNTRHFYRLLLEPVP